MEKVWLGEVVDINDPNKVGRIKIKVFGKFDELQTEHIPWAYPANNNTGGSSSGGGFLSVPKLGAIVSVKFENNNIYHPEYFFNQNISQQLKDEIKDSYENAHSLIYDTVTEGGLRVFFTEAKGLVLDYKKSIINIDNENNITITTGSNDSEILILNDGNIWMTHKNDVNIKAQHVIVDSGHIELGKGAHEKLVLGDTFMTFFNNHIHMTPNGPSAPPTTPMSPLQLSNNNSFTK